MKCCAFGERATVLGSPIGLALILTAFFYFYSISELLSLLRVDPPYIVYHYMGTMFSVSFDFPRKYFLIKMFTAVFWSMTTLANVSFCSRTVWFAYITFSWSCLYYLELFCGLLYSLYAFKNDLFIESQYALRRHHLKTPLSWPSHFFVAFTANLLVDALVAWIVLDMNWSFIKILQHNGSGWESKAYYEIHQCEGETVATLQAEWDAKMGLQGKQDPDVEKAMKWERIPSKQPLPRDNYVERDPLLNANPISVPMMDSFL